MSEEIKQTYGAEQIQVLEGLEAVRKRPGMYIGSQSAAGLHHLVYEIVDNAIDEAMAGYCHHIQVEIREGDVIAVKDDGRGIPTGIQPQTGKSALEVVFTVLHAGGKFGGGGYKVSGGLHGVGASVVNALSEWLEVRVCREGSIYEMKFSRGAVTQEMTVVGSTEDHGSEIVFKPDGEIFETLVFDYDTLVNRLREQAFLNAGVRIHLRDLRKKEDGSAGKEDDMCYEGGIRSFVSHINRVKTPIHDDVIYFESKKDTAQAEIAMQYTDSYKESLYSFANDIRTTDGGTHETGFKTALTSVLNAYGKAKKLLKDNETITGDDSREGLTAIISVKVEEAQFEGQTKTKLGNSDVRTLVDRAVREGFSEYLEEHPAEGKIIIEKALLASRAREAAIKAREATRRKSPLESGSMPDKLQDCNERDPSLCEIYIVEGDSAGGSAIQGRDSRFQAILSMWGKMLNVEKAREDKVYGNDKLNPVIMALGAGIGKDFNLEKLRYHKVIIMADADVDGAHIRTLLLTFFYRYMTPLITNGYVYSAVPPLYKLTRGKQTRVAYSDAERDQISAEMRGDNENIKIGISRFKGLGEMDPHELWETTMDPERRTLRRITLDDAMVADQVFSVLMGEQVEPRKQWIESNAQYAANIDV